MWTNWPDVYATVLEFVRHEWLAWDAYCNELRAGHAWVFERKDLGVYVFTDETWNGWLARLGALVMSGRMSKWNQRWSEELGQVAGCVVSKPPRSGVPYTASDAHRET